MGVRHPQAQLAMIRNMHGTIFAGRAGSSRVQPVQTRWLAAAASGAVIVPVACPVDR